MSALVPFRARTMSRAIVLAGMQNRAARARAARAAQARFWRGAVGTYNNTIWAAKKIQRAWKRHSATVRPKRRIGMGRIGQPAGRARAKRCSTAIKTNTSISTRTLYYEALTDIPKTTQNEIDSRQRDVIHLSGFKICGEVLNDGTNTLLFNMAVVYDKRANDETTAISTSDFFRSNEGNARAVDFSILLASHEFHCLPLNTDRFTVLAHKRWKLRTGFGVANGAGDPYWSNQDSGKFMEYWIPLKKKITFEDGHAQSKIWLLYWCDRWQTGPTNTPVANSANIDYRVVAYFREPKA